MKLKDFLLHRTKAKELCVICNPWRIATVWIDHKDLFIHYVDSRLKESEVINDEWDSLETALDNGCRIYIQAHYIYIKG